MKATTLLKLITTLVWRLNQDSYQLYLYSILCLTRVLLSLMSGIVLFTRLVEKITIYSVDELQIKFFLCLREKVEIPKLIRDD